MDVHNVSKAMKVLKVTTKKNLTKSSHTMCDIFNVKKDLFQRFYHNLTG